MKTIQLTYEIINVKKELTQNLGMIKNTIDFIFHHHSVNKTTSVILEANTFYPQMSYSLN